MGELDNRRAPTIISHRGARREAPENTIPAITRAIELGTGGVEFDVLLTKDKVPVLGHNNDLSILTHYHGQVHKTPFATVKDLDVGIHFGPKFAGTKSPTLAEVLEIVTKHNILTIIELKYQPGMHKSVARLVGGIVQDFRFKGPFIISSFSLRIVTELARSYPKLPRALVIKNPSWLLLKAKLLCKFNKPTAIHPWIKILNHDIVSHLHSRGLRVDTWTANTKDELDKCIQFGVDGIITDDTALAINYMKEKFGTGGAYAASGNGAGTD